MKNKLLSFSALVGTTALLATAAQAGPIVLNFENIAPYTTNGVFIQDFYNGGTASNGNSGPNLGVGFSDNALMLCLNTPGTTCSNTSRGGIGDPASAFGGLFFLSGAETFMNVAAGFDTGFSFNYSAINQGGSVSAYTGLNGTGTLLGTLILPTTTSACDLTYNAGFCPFSTAFLAFAGIAQSISFAGAANQIVFDDVTFGSLTPGNVPVPAALPLLVSGIGGLVAARRLRKRKADKAAA
jgi:hypothetical protein